MSYKVSVITTVYNGGEQLKIAVNSIINQSIGFKNIEYIIVDNCSTDNVTRELIKEYEEKYENVIGVLLDENSGGPGKPRNEAIYNYVTTDYIILLDHDDEYVENAVENLYNTIIEEDSDTVIGIPKFVFSNGDKYDINFRINERTANFNPMENNEEFEYLTQERFCAAWGKIFKTQTIKRNNIKFIEEGICEDWHFSYYIALNSKKVTLLNEVTYLYYIHATSTVNRPTLDIFNKQILGTTRLKELLLEYDKDLKILSNSFEGLLLRFTNLKTEDKKIAINDLYKLEKSLNTEIKFNKAELNFFNNVIMNKNFKLAILISNIYKKVYSNHTIKMIYKSYVNNRK